MASWWRILAEQKGFTESSTGSWSRRVATGESSIQLKGNLGLGSYAKLMTRRVIAGGTIGTAGVSHAKLIAAAPNGDLESSGPKMLSIGGLKSPLT